MKYQIDIQKSKATRRLKRKIPMVILLPQYFLLVAWMLGFPAVLGSMYFNAFRADLIVEVLFIFSIILSFMMLYSILTTNKLHLIHGLSAEQNRLLTEKISKKLDWKNSRSSRICNVFIPKWSWFSTHYGREVTVIYDSKEILINSTTFLRLDLISPFHWFADRSVEKQFKTEFEKEVEKHRHAKKPRRQPSADGLARRLAKPLWKIELMKQTLLTLIILLTCLSCASSGEQSILVDWEEKRSLFIFHKGNEEYEKALSAAKELVHVSEKNYPDHYRLADSYHFAGLAYSDLHHYQKAEEYFNKALSLDEKLNLSSAKNHYELAGIYESTNRDDLALKSIKRALDTYSSESTLDSSSISRVKLRMVSILTTKREYDQAYALLDELVAYGNATGDRSLIMDNARSYVKLSLHLGMFEQAQKIIEEVLDYHKRHNNITAYSSALNTQGAIYYRMQEYEKAVEFFKISADYKLQHFKDSTLIDLQLKNIAKTYEISGDTVHAQRYYKLYNSVKK